MDNGLPVDNGAWAAGITVERASARLKGRSSVRRHQTAHAVLAEIKHHIGNIRIVRRAKQHRYIQTIGRTGHRQKFEIAGMGGEDDERARIVAQVEDERNAGDLDAAGGRLDQTADRAQDGGFARPGWPGKGQAVAGAVPSDDHAMRYFIDTIRWAREDNIEIFYFAAFDEAWKVGAEGDVGAYWGLWDKDAKPKFA